MKRPPLVERAYVAARAAGLVPVCSDEVGAALHVLAAGRGVRRAAVVGVETGLVAAWVTAALPPGVPLFVVESEQARARVAAELFTDDADVHVLVGDWRHELPGRAPFDFILVGDVDAVEIVDDVVALATPRATIVLMDLPREPLAAGERRSAWLAHPRLEATMITTGEGTELVVAVVRG